jgi:hypothetical protein
MHASAPRLSPRTRARIEEEVARRPRAGRYYDSVHQTLVTWSVNEDGRIDRWVIRGPMTRTQAALHGRTLRVRGAASARVPAAASH